MSTEMKVLVLLGCQMLRIEEMIHMPTEDKKLPEGWKILEEPQVIKQMIIDINVKVL